MATEINCKAIAETIEAEAREMAAKFEAKTGHKPMLVTAIANNDPASKRYVRNKMRACERCGIDHGEHSFYMDTPKDMVEHAIDIHNRNALINGLMLQLPVWEQLNANELIQMIDPTKDVDCLTAQNMGKLALGDNSFMPATVAGIMRLFKEEHYDLQGKTVVIRGRSNIVGKPLALAMINAGATVISENSHSSFMLMNETDDVDIWVDATGKAACDNTRYVCDYYIDVTTRIGADGKLHGSLDWNQEGEAISEPLAGEDEWLYNMSCDYYTSVPGGVGLLTCAQLAWNTAYLACKQVGIETCDIIE